MSIETIKDNFPLANNHFEPAIVHFTDALLAEHIKVINKRSEKSFEECIYHAVRAIENPVSKVKLKKLVILLLMFLLQFVQIVK